MSSTEEGPGAQCHANAELIARLAPFVELVNALSDERVQWQVAFGRKDYVDALGDTIRAGANHFRKGQPSAQEQEVRLSASSMERFIAVLFTHNRQGVELAKRLKAERVEQLRREMLGADDRR